MAHEKRLKTIDQTLRKINPHLQGKGPEVQGAVLADLVAMYFAGHHPSIRQDAIAIWTAMMRNLIPVNEAAIFKHYGKPEGWEPN